MSTTRFHRRRTSIGLAAAAAVALLAAPLPASGSPPGGDRLATGSGTTSKAGSAAARAMARDFGISVDRARTQLARQRGYDRLADRLTHKLGAGRSGGAYLDGRTGTLVVTVTDAAAARQVRLTGATPREVRYSTRVLDRAHDALDRYAWVHGAGTVQGWYVDVRTNHVVVTAAKGPQAKASRLFVTKVWDPRRAVGFP